MFLQGNYVKRKLEVGSLLQNNRFLMIFSLKPIIGKFREELTPKAYVRRRLTACFASIYKQRVTCMNQKKMLEELRAS
jgi:hypothetical protein